MSVTYSLAWEIANWVVVGAFIALINNQEAAAVAAVLLCVEGSGTRHLSIGIPQ